MAFPRKLLNDDEDVVLDLRPHWWTLVPPIAAVALTVVVLVAARNVQALVYALLVVLVVALLAFLRRYLRWATTEFVVTTDRIIHRAGVVAKHGREIPLTRVNDITFDQSVFERLIGAGDLVIESGGERGQETFDNIPKPSIVQNIIYREIDRGEQRQADRMAGGRQLSLPEQLEKLDELRQRGVISQAEFDAKKQQLLDRM